MTRPMELGLLPFLVLLAILPFPGTVALRLLCLAAAFVYAIYVWRRAAVPPIPLKSAIAVWAVVALTSLFYAVDPGYSLSEIKNELGYTMMSFVAFFVVTSDEKRLKWMLFALSAGAFALCLGALVERFSQSHWYEWGGYGGTGSFAAYLVALVPMVVLLAFYFQDVRLRWLSLTLLGMLLVAGFFSLQRIVWPVLFLQAVVALLLYRKVFGFSRARVTVILVFLVLVASLFLSLAQMNRLIVEVPSTQIKNDDRLVFWPKVVGRIVEQPLIGAGFGRSAMKAAHRDLIPPENTLLWHAHNVVLNYGLAMGVPGIVAILLVFGALLKQYACFWRSGDRRLRMLGACGIVFVLGVVSRNMVNDFFLRDQAILFWALNGILLGVGCRQRSKVEAPQVA